MIKTKTLKLRGTIMDNRTREKREKVLEKMFKLAVDVVDNYTAEKNNKLWDMSLDWNREHEDCEIIMCETCDDNGNVNGFMIEDYPYYFTD